MCRAPALSLSTLPCSSPTPDSRITEKKIKDLTNGNNTAQSLCFPFIYSDDSSLIHNMASEQNLLENTAQGTRSLAAINCHCFTGANGFTPICISWGSDPLFLGSQFLTKLCFFLFYKNTCGKKLWTALPLVYSLLIFVSSFSVQLRIKEWLLI